MQARFAVPANDLLYIESLAESFAEKLIAALKEIKMGDPLILLFIWEASSAKKRLNR